MNLRLSVQIPDYPFRISHQDCIFSMGSCFAAHIGERLSARKFSLVSNPFGIVYNPASIHKALQLLLTDYQFSESDFFQQGELWHSYYHHGQFSGTNLAKAIIRVQTSAQHARQYLRRCNRLLLTLGTAQVYTLKTRGEIVANCHKMPRQAFDKRRLSVAEIVAYLQPVLAQLRASSQDFQCILTVSPVRHWRDGLVENQRSKSALLLAAAELSDTLGYVHYFPAYEWIIDELRDYRFYNKDMAHPNELAQDYIWSHFQTAFFSPSTSQLNRQIEQLIRARQHRPLHPETRAHRQFRATQWRRTHALQQAHPQLDLGDLLAFFQDK